MLKQSMLIGVLLVAASCGHNNKPSSVVDPITDSLVVVGKPIGGKTDSSAFELFIPEGYSVLDTSLGDLNLDQYRDLILVLKKKGEDTTSDAGEDPEKRPLLILLGIEANSFKLAARNDNAVYCFDCGGMMGDPFVNVVIREGYFSVEHYGGSAWRWTRTVTFKYSPSDTYWYLHKDGGDSFHAADAENITTEIRTEKDFGKIPFDKFDIYKEK